MFPTKEGTTIKIRNLIFLSGYNTFILIPFKSLPLVNRLSTLNPSIYSRNLTTIHLGSIGGNKERRCLFASKTRHNHEENVSYWTYLLNDRGLPCGERVRFQQELE